MTRRINSAEWAECSVDRFRRSVQGYVALYAGEAARLRRSSPSDGKEAPYMHSMLFSYPNNAYHPSLLGKIEGTKLVGIVQPLSDAAGTLALVSCIENPETLQLVHAPGVPPKPKAAIEIADAAQIDRLAMWAEQPFVRPFPHKVLEIAISKPLGHFETPDYNGCHE